MKKLKTKEELLKAFKKANKIRRQAIANRAGFDGPDEYRAHLEEQIKNDQEEGNHENLPEEKEGAKPLDMVIAFDTTGSMRHYIQSVKLRVRSLLDELFNSSGKDLRIKIVAFGDYCDMVSPESFGKAYQYIELTNDKEALSEFVVSAKNTYGGDGNEFYELVLKKIIEETSWRDHSQKSLLLIGDAPPHDVGYSCRPYVHNSQINWREELKKYVDANISIDTLSIDYYSRDFYEKLSADTNGVHIPFKNAEKTNEIIKGTVYARTSTESFYKSMSEAEVSGDDELVGAYKAMSSLI